MEINNIITNSNTSFVPPMDASQASWVEMLQLYNQMKTAANNLAFELNQNPPNWITIETDIGELKKDCTQMIAVAAGLPGDQSGLIHTLDTMSSALNFMWIEMQYDDQTGITNLLHFFQGGMSTVFQAIMQG